MSRLGSYYFFGSHGLTKNEEEAKRLFFAAAEQGHAASCVWAASFLLRMLPSSTMQQPALSDCHLAVNYLYQAVEEEPTAGSLLAACFAKGTGVSRDIREAQRWKRFVVSKGELLM